MLNYFLERNGNEPVILTSEEEREIRSLADSKYRTWEWNYAYGPEYYFRNRFVINNKPHACTFFVKDGIIRESEIEGSREINEASKKLAGCRHMPEDIRETFRKNKIEISVPDIFMFF
jgi:lipoate-protein ligase A